MARTKFYDLLIGVRAGLQVKILLASGNQGFLASLGSSAGV